MGNLMERVEEHFFLWKTIRHSIKKTETVTVKRMNDPIDFVVLWVDDQDPQWRLEKKKFEHNISNEKNHRDNGEERYRDWGLFHYWFRAVEQYAPWVRHVYLVTCGHYPKWLNRESPKLKLVKHSDFIPAEYLPTFNSVSIEAHIHKIPGLAEHFVYFNDDLFLCRPAVPEDFFQAGLPNCTAIAKPLRNESNGVFDHMMFTAYGAINNYYNGDVSRRILENPEKWFSAQYGSFVEYNIRAVKQNYIPGMHFTHLPVPFRKQTCENVWKAFSSLFAETSSHRFRTPQDAMHILFTMWEIMEGSFNAVAMEHHGMHFWDPVSQVDEIIDAIKQKKYQAICINDSESVSREDFDIIKEKIFEAFACALPEKSSFEK